MTTTSFVRDGIAALVLIFSVSAATINLTDPIVIEDGRARRMPAVVTDHLGPDKVNNPILDTDKLSNPVLGSTWE